TLHAARPASRSPWGADDRAAGRAHGTAGARGVSKRRPGRLWLFFYGRKRRGFPGLLVALVVAVAALGALYRLPGGADLSRFAIVVTVSALVLLIVASLALVAIAMLRPRRGRR